MCLVETMANAKNVRSDRYGHAPDLPIEPLLGAEIR